MADIQRSRGDLEAPSNRASWVVLFFLAAAIVVVGFLFWAPATPTAPRASLPQSTLDQPVAKVPAPTVPVIPATPVTPPPTTPLNSQSPAPASPQ